MRDGKKLSPWKGKVVPRALLLSLDSSNYDAGISFLSINVTRCFASYVSYLSNKALKKAKVSLYMH